ncbi:hypothetical protein OXX79_007102 [Metschnikowia pulcherrima]
MSEYTIISRASLYESEDDSSQSQDEPQYDPHLEFVEVDVQNLAPKDELDQEASSSHDDEEFAFPLFAGAGKSQDEVMKVSLREEDDDVVINERPESYYRAIYNEDQRQKFESAALSYDQILMEATATAVDTHPWKVINLIEHNKKIELEQKQKRNRREGKRKRQNKIICRERREDREREIKRLEREEKKLRYRARGQGWNVNKPRGKSEKPRSPAAKPKYRTE